MKADFEEKQYEQHLNNELLDGSNLLFPPGQVLEHTLGFDAAIFTRAPQFWRYFFHICHGNVPRGLKLTKELWQDVIDSIDHLPPFKFNVFIQHKRPEYMRNKSAREWHSWNSPYYRYDTVPHQQDALCRLEERIGDKGVVVYACPAFHSSTEFWDKVKTRSVVRSSNFCQPTLLKGHQRFTFQKPGAEGVAHSDPEPIQSYDVLERMEELRGREPEGNNLVFLKSLGQVIDGVAEASDHIRQPYLEISGYLSAGLENFPVAVSLIKLDVFRFLVRCDHFIGY